MPRSCSICTNPNRAQIDQALVAGSPSNRAIARQYRVTHDALDRHKANHLTKALTAAASRRAEEGDSLVERIHRAHERSESLYSAAEGILRMALESADSKTALKSISAAVAVLGEARQWAELHGTLSGELSRGQDSGPVTINVNYVESPVVSTSRLEFLPATHREQ